MDEATQRRVWAEAQRIVGPGRRITDTALREAARNLGIDEALVNAGLKPPGRPGGSMRIVEGGSR